MNIQWTPQVYVICSGQGTAIGCISFNFIPSLRIDVLFNTKTFRDKERTGGWDVESLVRNTTSCQHFCQLPSRVSALQLRHHRSRIRCRLLHEDEWICRGTINANPGNELGRTAKTSRLYSSTSRVIICSYFSEISADHHLKAQRSSSSARGSRTPAAFYLISDS
jgi:hypothetical protein